jgi:predicted transcriptional regulator
MTKTPETQRESWESLQEHLPNRRRTVLRAIQAAPATLFELSTRLDLPVNCISGRVNELRHGGFIRQAEDALCRKQTRRNPFGGKAGIVWEAVPAVGVLPPDGAAV